jgi:Na+-translocating ferredoxin:NAD+ oxidoreductase RnfG subunit
MTALLLALVLVGACCGAARAKSYQTQQQAIAAAFPSQQVERKTLFLTKEQAESVEKLARAKVGSRMVSYYVSRGPSGVAGVAFFDRQIVRDMPVTFMVAVKPSGEVDRVEVLSFDEPEDYLPPLRWLQLYRSRRLNDDLAIGRGIPHITGASLTSQAMNDGVRRALATFEIGVKGTL